MRQPFRSQRLFLSIIHYPMSTVILCVLIVFSLLVLAGCGNRGANNRNDTIVIAFSNEPNRLNPVFLSDLTSYTLSGWVFNGLTKLDDELNVVRDLAESWSISQDGLMITFYLKKGILWHDGKELTAKDVIFTFNTIVSPQIATPRSSQFGPVQSIQALDPYTIIVKYKEPYGSALMSWTIGIVPEHILKDLRNDFADFDRAPIGTGPYRLREWISGQRLVFEAFEQHFSGTPQIKKVVVRILPDATTRLLELKKGGIDMMELTPLQFAKNTGNNTLASHFVKYRSPSYRYAFFGFNLLDERFRDKRVRDAIGYGIDKEAMIASVLFGLGEQSTGPYPPGTWYGNSSLKHFQYDPEKAVILLREAGWQGENNGLLKKKGKPFSFTILTNFESEENSKIAQIIQNSLKTLGMDVKINQLEWQTFRHDVINKHEFETIVLSRAYMWDPDLFDLWHSSRKGEGNWNFMSYQSPWADSLLEKGRRTQARPDRAEIYKKFHAVIAEEKPCIFLYSADGLFIAHKRIKGVKPSPQGIYQNIKDFFVSEFYS
jgi:peptide/nickel transport system substrate-binding protein